MAHLAQVRLTLDISNLSDERIVVLGRLADEVARQVALDVYGGGVEVDVVLQDGSLLTKITVIGGLLLGTYHGVAAYPDFKDGITELCDDAAKYSTEFVDRFLHASGTSKRHVEKVNISAKTPGKLKRLLNKLERLDYSSTRIQPTPKTKDELSTAKRALESIEHDITDAEADHIRTLLEFRALPSVESDLLPLDAPVFG